jgi:pimeloyl-ACP methyl ester carboxylesterase
VDIQNKLSVRQPGSPIGGAVADTVRLAAGSSPDGRSKVVLFVHGYNNSAPDADTAYGRFLTDLMSASATTRFHLPAFGFYWPGDTHIKIISTIGYPFQIDPAIDSASRLFAFVSTLQGPGGTPIEINLVGHSLGCRLVLELVKQIAAGALPLVVIRDIVLMAAAVPVSKVEDLDALGRAATFPRSSLVLFSDADLVLQLAFPLGETVASDAFFPTAVGRFGQPSRIWTGGARKMVHANQNGYAHGDYWPGEESAAAAGTFLGNASASPPLVNGIFSRPLLENVLPANPAVGVRSLPARPAFG